MQMRKVIVDRSICRWPLCGAHLLGNDRNIARAKSEDSGLVQVHMSGFDICPLTQQTKGFLRRLVDIFGVQRLDIGVVRRFGL